jgi:hypothetical protein
MYRQQNLSLTVSNSMETHTTQTRQHMQQPEEISTAYADLDRLSHTQLLRETAAGWTGFRTTVSWSPT